MSSCEQVFRSNWTCQIKTKVKTKSYAEGSSALGESDTNSVDRRSEIQVATTVSPNKVKNYSVDGSSEKQIPTTVNLSSTSNFIPDTNIQSDIILEDTPYGCFGAINESNDDSTYEVKHADSADEVFQIQLFMDLAINVSQWQFMDRRSK